MAVSIKERFAQSIAHIPKAAMAKFNEHLGDDWRGRYQLLYFNTYNMSRIIITVSKPTALGAQLLYLRAYNLGTHWMLSEDQVVNIISSQERQ